MSGFFARTGVKVTLGLLFLIAVAGTVWYLSRKWKEKMLKQVEREQLAIQEAEDAEEAAAVAATKKEAMELARITAKVGAKIDKLNAEKEAEEVEAEEVAEPQMQQMVSLVQMTKQSEQTDAQPKAKSKAKNVPFTPVTKAEAEPQTGKTKKTKDVPVGTSREEHDAFNVARAANTVASWTAFLAGKYPTNKLKSRGVTAYEVAVASASATSEQE